MINFKTPFSWVGNKYKFINEINKIVEGKYYNRVVDMFMGSGNVLFNISAKANDYIGNDNIKLLPGIYNQLYGKEYIYTLLDVENILNKFNRFSTKESYYTFRAKWNKKYLGNIFDKEFIMETILLLKMCSNSMVRFNPKEGYFNQGFRGLGKKLEFFTESMKMLCVDGLNKLIENMQERIYEFRNTDFIDYVDVGEEDLLILDPPYILRKDMYDTSWTEAHDRKLIELMSTTKNDFIYFNYIERNGIVNQDLMDFITKSGLSYILINSKTLAGQGRNENITDVKEVIITNV